MSPHILALDIAGAPHRWINVRDAARYYATDTVAWAIGSNEFVLRGGTQRSTGMRSVIRESSALGSLLEMSASRPISQSGSQTSRFSHSKASDASQMRRSSSIACPHVEALRNKEYAGAMFSAVLEGTEVSWHRADIVRNEHSLLFRRQRQDLGSVMRRNPAA